MAQGSMAQKCIAEFVGTFILMFTVGCNTLTEKYVWGVTSNAFVLMALVYAFGDISGGHFNPAVTIAAAISLRMPTHEAGLYCLSQVVGAICGAITYTLLFWEAFTIAPKPGFVWWQAGLAEAQYTGMLCFVVLCAAQPVFRADGKPREKQFFGLAIGFVLIAGGYGAGAISGGVFNPALAFAIDITSLKLGYGWSFVYVGFQLMGAAAASLCSRVVQPLWFAGTAPTVLDASSNLRLSDLMGEFLGTFMLVYTLGLNILGGSRATAWSVGASLTCMLYAVGPSGHFNPAVTFAIVASGRCKCSATKGMAFVMVQLLAGIFAAWTFAFMHRWRTFSLGPVGDYNWLTRSAIEIFFTSILCYVVLCTATVSANRMFSEYYGLAIGLCVVVGGWVVGNAAGGTMNPAATFGIASTTPVCGKFNCIGFFWAPLYMLLEILGGAVAVGVFHLTHSNEYPKTMLT